MREEHIKTIIMPCDRHPTHSNYLDYQITTTDTIYLKNVITTLIVTTTFLLILKSCTIIILEALNEVIIFDNMWYL